MRKRSAKTHRKYNELNRIFVNLVELVKCSKCKVYKLKSDFYRCYSFCHGTVRNCKICMKNDDNYVWENI